MRPVVGSGVGTGWDAASSLGLVAISRPALPP